MARRKRKDDVPDWSPPDFDDVGYMRAEMTTARAAVITIAWAAVGAIVAFLLYSVNPALAFFAGIAVAFGLYYVLPFLGISVSGFKRRDWMSHGITYFFSWLAFWILLLNPPFGDFTTPTIQGITVSPFQSGNLSGELSCLPVVDGKVSIPLSAPNNSAYILFRATDNVRLTSLEVNVTPAGVGPTSFSLTPVLQSGYSRCSGHTSELYPGGTYNVSFLFSASSYHVKITARDPGGLTATEEFTILPK